MSEEDYIFLLVKLKFSLKKILHAYYTTADQTVYRNNDMRAFEYLFIKRRIIYYKSNKYTINFSVLHLDKVKTRNRNHYNETMVSFVIIDQDLQ